MKLLVILLGLLLVKDFHSWFDSLSNGLNTPCCSTSDGTVVEPSDWGTDKDGYWVDIYGQHLKVPSWAIVVRPNLFGRAVVWTYWDAPSGKLKVRCFLPGAGT